MKSTRKERTKIQVQKVRPEEGPKGLGIQTGECGETMNSNLGPYLCSLFFGFVFCFLVDGKISKFSIIVQRENRA